MVTLFQSQTCSLTLKHPPVTLNSTSTFPDSCGRAYYSNEPTPALSQSVGILPNQLRTLLKESSHENREEAILDLSRTLFFAGFRIWDKRQKLASRFWKDIAPENRKIIHTNNKGRKKKQDNSAPSKCRNPFHLLPR